MSAGGAPKVNLDKPMDRYTARRLADAIKSIAGYRVERTYTAPADAGAYVIDVTDTVTKLQYVVTGPASWLDARGASARERRLMVSRDAFPASHTAAPEVSDVAEAPPAVAPTPPPTREEPKTMTQSPPAAPATRGGGFNFEQWTSITRTAIETAEVHIERLQAERGRLDEQVREAERRVKTRRQEIDGQVAELRGTMKKLQRAIDVVDRPTRATETSGQGPRLRGPKGDLYRPLILAWAKQHKGEVRTLELIESYRDRGYPKGAFNKTLSRMVSQNEAQHIGAGLYRVVAP